MYEMEGPRWQHRTLTADHSAATSDEATASFEGPIKVPVSRLSKRPRVSPEMASAFRGEAFLLPLAGRAQGVSVHLSKILSSSTGQMPFIPRIGPLSTDYPHVNAQEQWNRARPLRSEAAAGRTHRPHRSRRRQLLAPQDRAQVNGVAGQHSAPP